MNIGTPLTNNSTKVLLCGSGELGKEVAIELQRYGCEVIAIDRYDNAPAMQVAHRSYSIDMLDEKALRSIIEKEKPNFEFKTWLGKKETVKGKTKEDVFITLNKKDIRNFKVSIKYDGPIKAPIKKNDQIGEIIVKTSDVENVIVPVYASEDVKKVNFIKSLFMSFNYMIWGDV